MSFFLFKIQLSAFPVFFFQTNRDKLVKRLFLGTIPQEMPQETESRRRAILRFLSLFFHFLSCIADEIRSLSAKMRVYLFAARFRLRFCKTRSIRRAKEQRLAFPFASTTEIAGLTAVDGFSSCDAISTFRGISRRSDNGNRDPCESATFPRLGEIN